MANLSKPARFGTEGGLMGLPYGFRFNPTDEEVVVHYLIPKAVDSEFSVPIIGQADFNTCEPWDLPKIENMEDSAGYYFWQRDRKYPTGLRTNRATKAGYWKATGKDREIYTGSRCRRELIGMRKTLVFYTGRAPKGEKTNWVMHEYRLQPQFFISFRITQNEEWVVSKVFHKNNNSAGGAASTKTYSDEGNCDSFSQKADSLSTADQRIIKEDFESLPPLVDHSALLPPPPTPLVKPLIWPMVPSYDRGFQPDQPHNVGTWPPASAVDPYQGEDQLIYAENPAFYPSYAATLLPPDPFYEPPKPDKINKIDDVVEPPPGANYSAETSSHVNQRIDDEFDDELDLPSLGSMPDLSILWD